MTAPILPALRAPSPISPRGLVNILNPKLSILYLAFLPQFVAADNATPVGRMLLPGTIFMAMTFVVFVGYGTFASHLRRHVAGSPDAAVPSVCQTEIADIAGCRSVFMPTGARTVRSSPSKR